MNDRTAERQPSATDREMLSEAIEYASALLKLPEGCVPSEIQRRIHACLEELDGRREEVDENLLASLGALWGQAICTGFRWEWIIAVHGEWESLGISDAKRSYLALPFDYFDALVGVHPENVNLSSLLLYNCIKGNNLPESAPGRYTLVAHGER